MALLLIGTMKPPFPAFTRATTLDSATTLTWRLPLPRLVEAGADERHGVREFVVSETAQIANGVRDRAGGAVGGDLANRAPRRFGTLERDQRDLRGAVPVVLHGVMVVLLLAVLMAVAAVKRAMKLRADEERVVHDDLERFPDERIGALGGAGVMRLQPRC